MRPHNRFTVFDALEAKGHFSANPANVGSTTPDGQVLYSGPVEYPKMFYHPQGETRITVPAEVTMTPVGVKFLGEQKEIIWRIARDESEGKKLLAAGWHDHPGKAITAGGGVAPPSGPGDRIRELERQLAEAKAVVKEQAEKLEELG